MNAEETPDMIQKAELPIHHLCDVVPFLLEIFVVFVDLPILLVTSLG
jgi:hypothetical protein